MKKGKRLTCLLLSLLMCGFVLTQPLHAAQTVYFTSVNDTLLDLSDDTMPFWRDNVLYVAGDAFNESDLGTTYSRSRDKKTAIIYRGSEVLVADFSAGTLENSATHEKLSSPAIVRGSTVFFPVGEVTKFFGFAYSCTKVDYGYLVRICSASAILPDSAFIDAAKSPMAVRYSQYEKEHPESVYTVPGSENDTGSESVYLMLTVTSEESSEKALAALSENGSFATFLLSAQQLETMPQLLRHIAVSGCSVALRIDAAKGEEAVLAAIERANEALWLASNTKTRLVLLVGTADASRAAVVAAGYCPIAVNADFSTEEMTASRMASRCMSIAGSEGQCIAYLGEDSALQSTLAPLAAALRDEGCVPARINEVAATRK